MRNDPIATNIGAAPSNIAAREAAKKEGKENLDIRRSSQA
jgi:hypothetical protein